jgi:hypothetical protein
MRFFRQKRINAALLCSSRPKFSLFSDFFNITLKAFCKNSKKSAAVLRFAAFLQ